MLSKLRIVGKFWHQACRQRGPCGRYSAHRFCSARASAEKIQPSLVKELRRPEQINPESLESTLPFDARFLEALDLKKVSAPSEFEVAVSAAFDQIDLNGDGRIDRCEAEKLLKDVVYDAYPPEVWAITPSQLLQKLGGRGGTGGSVTRAEFSNAVQQIADTLDYRVWPLAQSQFFSAIMFALNQPLMPLLVKELGISMAQFGGMTALMPLIRVALAFPATFFANRHGRKPLTVQGQMVAAAGFGLSSFVVNPLQLILCRLVIGAGTSFAGVGQQNMLGDIATSRTRSRVFAPGQMRASIAFSIGPFVGGWLASTVSVQAAYVLIGAGMAAVSVRNQYILTETLRPARAGRGPGRPHEATLQRSVQCGRGWFRTVCLFAKDPKLRAATFASFSFNFTSISAKFVVLPMLVLEGWTLGASGLGGVLGAISLVQSFASTPAAYIADKYGREFALLPGLALTAVALAVASSGLDPLTAVPLVCSSWAFGSALVGSVPSALGLDAAARCNFDQQETSRVLALSRIVGDLGMMVGCIASGALMGTVGAPATLGVQAGALALSTAVTACALRAPR